jgi:lipopolysaccharide/colanic/teichoic acid biosynthesis glycosyltransferase
MPDAAQRMIAAVVLVVVSPALLVLGIAIRLESPGPALYRARRVGEGGRTFVCYKLRTMTGARTAGRDPRISRANDPRVTRLGRRLRALRLDELPQLWNVARGEMRLVGPRPEDPAFVDLGEVAHREVFTARPGITGLAQLAFVDEAMWLTGDESERLYRELVQPRKVAVDLAYLRRRGPRLDLWILASTAATVLGRRPDPARISAIVGNDDWRLPSGSAQPPA